MLCSAQQPTTPAKAVSAPKGSQPAHKVVAPEARPDWLAGEITYSAKAQKAKPYAGKGEDMQAPLEPLSGGMMDMVAPKDDNQKTHAYLAGEVTAPAGGQVLIVECKFVNKSATEQLFRSLDIELSGNPGKLLAVGLGDSYPFAKEKIKPSGTRVVTYVFGVMNDAPSWDLMYRGVLLAEIRPRQNLGPRAFPHCGRKVGGYVRLR